MNTIQSPRPRVKSARPARRFGEGVLATHPGHRLDCTIGDYEWWTEQARREEDMMFDRLGREAAAMDRMENGLEPW